MATLNLEMLPGEILAPTFGFLACDLSVEEWWDGLGAAPRMAALRSLCLVSRRFRSLAQPLLFRHIAFTQQRWDSGCKYLAMTLLENPSLGLQTRSLLVGPRWEADINTNDLGLSERELLKRLGQLDLPPRFGGILRHQIAGIRYFDPMILCVALMPNLQFLHFGEDARSSMLLWMLSGRLNLELNAFFPANDIKTKLRAFRLNRHQRNGADNEDILSKQFRNYGLPNLKEIRYNHGSSQRASDIRSWEELLLHPGIEVIRAFGVDWRQAGVAALRWGHVQSNIQALELKSCVIDSEGLKNIFHRCPNLSRLSIERGNHKRMYDLRDSEVLELTLGTNLWDVIAEHGGKLTTLSLYTNGGHVPPIDPTPSLVQLTGLRHLAFPRTYSLDTGHSLLSDPSFSPLGQVLPRGLQTLYLHFRDGRLDEFSGQELLDVLASSEFRALWQVEIETSWDFDKPIGFTPEGWSMKTVKEPVSSRDPSDKAVRRIVVFTRQGRKSDVRVRKEGFVSSGHELL